MVTGPTYVSAPVRALYRPRFCAAAVDAETARMMRELGCKPGDRVFTTQYGSVYRVEGKGTRRYKSERAARDCGGEPGLNDPSTTTIFVDNTVADRIHDLFYKSHPGTYRTLYAYKKAGRVTFAVYSHTLPECKDANLLYEFTQFTKTPTVGLTPIEIWYEDDKRFKDLHQGHPVSRIIS